MKKWFLTIAVTVSVSSCALWERHESIARVYQYEGQAGFTYYLGYHLLREGMETLGKSKREVTINLLEAALEKEGVCPLGYIVKKTIYTRHADPMIYGVCKTSN